MLRIIFFLSLFFLYPSAVSAEKIYMKDGTVFEGKVVKKDTSFVYIRESANSPVKRLFADEVDRILKDEEAEKIVEVDVTQFPTISERKAQLIVDLLYAIKMKEVLQQQVQQVLQQAPAERKSELETFLNVDEILSTLIPVYDRHYTEEELQQLTAFYSTPVGQKMLAQTPQIMKETLEATLSYFQEKLKNRP